MRAIETLQEIKNFQVDDLQEKQKDDDEMEVSDGEEPAKKKSREMTEERNSLKDENDSLKCQVEAYKNEVSKLLAYDLRSARKDRTTRHISQVEVIKVDSKKAVEDKELQIKMMQQTLQGMQQQLVETKKKLAAADQRVKALENRTKSTTRITEIINLDDDETEPSDSASAVSNSELSAVQSTISTVVPSLDAKLIGIVSIFLHVHPFGAGLDYITSYVNKCVPSLRPSDVEALMMRYTTLFKQDLVGIGASMERRWVLTAFSKGQQSSSNSNSEWF